MPVNQMVSFIIINYIPPIFDFFGVTSSVALANVRASSIYIFSFLDKIVIMHLKRYFYHIDIFLIFCICVENVSISTRILIKVK
jgi:hypothetical protein